MPGAIHRETPSICTIYPRREKVSHVFHGKEAGMSPPSVTDLTKTLYNTFKSYSSLLMLWQMFLLFHSTNK